MARTTITPTPLTPLGTAATYEPANVDGNMFANRGIELLHIDNASGSPIIVTIPTPQTVNPESLAVADVTINIPAGTDAFAGPFAVRTYNQKTGADKGKIYVDYDLTASVTVAVLVP